MACEDVIHFPSYVPIQGSIQVLTLDRSGSRSGSHSGSYLGSYSGFGQVPF